RSEDLPMLLEHVLSGIAAAEQDAAFVRSEAFLSDLAHHGWPGNVRELRNYVERCVALRQRVPLSSDAFGGPQELPRTTLPLKTAGEKWTRTLEHRYVEALLRRHDDNVAAAARAAGVDRMHFYRLLWRYGLR